MQKCFHLFHDQSNGTIQKYILAVSIIEMRFESKFPRVTLKVSITYICGHKIFFSSFHTFIQFIICLPFRPKYSLQIFSFHILFQILSFYTFGYSIYESTSFKLSVYFKKYHFKTMFFLFSFNLYVLIWLRVQCTLIGFLT